jgi:hypothetical protein
MMILSGGLISTPIGQAGDVRRFPNCVARILRRVSLTQDCVPEKDTAIADVISSITSSCQSL